MKKQENTIRKFESLFDFHRVFGQPKPLHPLISLIDIRNTKILPDETFTSSILDFYRIAYKTNVQGKAKYGQNYYDFGEGGLLFSTPNQILERPKETGQSGYVLLIHPDCFLTYPLFKKIKQYGFFSYAVNEASNLSDSEKKTILSIFKIIEVGLDRWIISFLKIKATC